MDTLKNVCDSVAGMAKGCQPIVKVAETNCADVEIVKMICITIAIVSIGLVALSLIWHYINVSASKKQEITLLENQITKIKQEQKTDYEKSIDLLNNIVDKVKDKDGKFEIKKAKELLGFYKEIKTELEK